MKWFQHSVDSHDDPDIFDAESLFGDSGYSVFFKILELYGREYNSIDAKGNLRISWGFLRRKLRKTRAKVRQILNFYEERQRIFHKIEGDYIIISIPQFIDIASNWTKRPKQEKPTNLCSSSVAPTAKEVEEEVEVEVDKKRTYAQFEKFWNSYPKKKSKGQAEKAFLKINPDEQLLAMIIATIEQAKTSEDWIKESGKYIPYPATWLNAKGWEDEDIKINKEVINGSYQPPTQFPIDIE